MAAAAVVWAELRLHCHAAPAEPRLRPELGLRLGCGVAIKFEPLHLGRVAHGFACSTCNVASSPSIEEFTIIRSSERPFSEMGLSLFEGTLADRAKGNQKDFRETKRTLKTQIEMAGSVLYWQLESSAISLEPKSHLRKLQFTNRKILKILSWLKWLLPLNR